MTVSFVTFEVIGSVVQENKQIINMGVCSFNETVRFQISKGVA